MEFIAEPGIERERRFLTPDIPRELLAGEGTPILQGYITPEKADVEVRIRTKGEKRYLTVKRGLGMVREEEELEIGPREFEGLWRFVGPAHLRKTRYITPLSHVAVEIDVYVEPLAPLVVSEIEFRPVDVALFEYLPDWIGTEITGLTCFTNRNLAYGGLPKEFSEYLGIAREYGPQPITHVAGVPYRISNSGFDILCVLSQEKREWILPYGLWDPRTDLKGSAEGLVAKTTGATGSARTEPLGNFGMHIEGLERWTQVFPCLVEDGAPAAARATPHAAACRWFSVADALQALHDDGAVRAIKALHVFVKSN